MSPQKLSLSALFFISIFTLLQFILPVLPVAQASPALFSTQKALEHLALISKLPRPPGSLQHSKTRDYIIQELTHLGLTPVVQNVDLPGTGEKLENVMARLSGSDSSGSVVLVAHYDTEVNTPGAGDNGTGTAILLEIARSLTLAGSLKNDIIVLFSDGEELGMLGTTAFVTEHPWMSNVRIAINFDTFTFGPAFMWQTSSQNGWLIRQYLASVPQPMASSWLYDVSRLVPLDTDLTPFINAGVSGYNFSTSFLYPEIQTAQDQIGIVNPGSVQHAGEQGSVLAQYLAKADLTQIKAPDLIYFNLWGPLVVWYPVSWAMPIAIFTVLILFVVVGQGLKKHAISWHGVWQGILIFLLALSTMLMFSLLIWGAGFFIKPVVFTAWIADPRHSSHDWLFFAGFIALAVGIILFIYQAALRKNTLSNLMVGIFFFWSTLGLMSSYYMPGASFLFLWPLLLRLLAMAGNFSVNSGEYRPNQLAAGIIELGASTLTVLLWMPFILLFFLATAMGAFPVLVICIVIFLGFLLPWLVHPAQSSPKLFSGIAVLAGLLFFTVGMWVS
jgi:hypothetical protein